MPIAETKFWRVTVFAVVAMTIASLLCYFVLWSHFYETLPRSPDVAAGRIYPENFHGFVLYETRGENALLNRVENLTLVLVFLSVAAGAFSEWRLVRRRK
jgi:hypothetical protein